MQNINLNRNKWINWNSNRRLAVKQPLPDSVFDILRVQQSERFHSTYRVTNTIIYFYYFIERLNYKQTNWDAIQANRGAFQALKWLFSD